MVKSSCSLCTSIIYLPCWLFCIIKIYSITLLCNQAMYPNVKMCSERRQIRRHYFSFNNTSLVVQWLRLWTSTAGDTGLIPGWGTLVPRCHLAWPQKKNTSLKWMDWGLQLHHWKVMVRPNNPTTEHIPWGNHNWKRHMYPNVHCSTVYNSRGTEAT